MSEPKTSKSQVDKFRELARKIGATESEEPLNEALKKIAKSPPPKDDKAKSS